MTFRIRNVRFAGLRSLCCRRVVLVIALLLIPTFVLAADRRGRKPKFGEFNPDHQTVEMFGAIGNKQIDVKLIPKDSTQCNVLIENKTNRPLNVKLPEAFAGVPVLAQAGGMGGAGGFGGGGGGQAMGGGMGGGAGMGGGGGGFFNVPPEKVGKFKVTTVCLQHGKPEPRPAMKYEVKPIEEFTDKPAVHELCRMLGTGRLNQRAAQVAAWHLMDNMSFQQLAAKQYKYANGGTSPYFTPQQLQAGMQYTAMAVKLAEQRDKSKSPGDTDSASTHGGNR